MEELISSKNIIDLDNKIEIINVKFTLNNNDINYSNLTAKQVNRVVDTIIFNSKTTLKKNRLLQRSIYSTQIHPDKHEFLHGDLEKLFYKYYDEIESTFLDYESDVEMDTYPEYGVSLFEYKTEE